MSGPQAYNPPVRGVIEEKDNRTPVLILGVNFYDNGYNTGVTFQVLDPETGVFRDFDPDEEASRLRLFIA